MPCPCAQTQNPPSVPASVVHDFADLPVLLGEDETQKRQVGNPIIPPGAGVPADEQAERAEPEQRRDSPKEKPSL